MVTQKELLEAVLQAREGVNAAEVILTDAKEIKKEAEGKMLELMELQDLKSFKVEGLGNVTRKEKLYTSVNKDDQPKLLVWIDEEAGRPDMIKRSVHPATLNSFIGQRLKDGEAVPNYVNTFFKPILTIRKE